MHKRSAVRAALRGKRLAIAVAAAFVPLGQAYCLPTGEQVVHGQVNVARPDAATMHINHATQRGIVNWQGFSIDLGETVLVNQAATATLLSRVVGNDPSRIFGTLSGQGNFFLVNNAGVFFAPGSSVSFGSLVASTLSITDQDFINGIYRFTNPGNAGAVVNAGTIVTAGGYTALVGPQVRNDGVIVANSGKIALGAGNGVRLDMIGDGLVSIVVEEAAFNASVINTGTLQADGGTVLLKASSANALLDTVINTSGIVRANSLVAVNGEIILDGGGAVQVAGTVEAIGGAINVSADSALNVGSTVCCAPTQVVANSQNIEGGSVTVGGGANVITLPGAGSQTVTTPGTLLVRGGVLSGGVGLFHNGSGEQRITAGNLELRGGSGTNTGAFINSNAGGDQVVTVTGALMLTGGASGTGNRAGIVSTGNQTINGNPDIVLTGGASGGAGNNANNVFIQATGPDTTQQTINARTIQINAGAGTDASATINAARQVISTLGNVSIFGSGGLGGSNGARIGGIGGTTLGPTNLTLTVGGNLLLQGGTANGASLGSSGASTQANTITVNATGDVTLESLGAGARIGSSNQSPVPLGNITVTAGGELELDTGTAIRANGPITLTANSLTNDGTITNGGGSNTANIIFNADAFNLAGGTIEGGAAAVVLRPRTGTNSFGIEAAGATTLTNADIASINTSNFVILGSSTGTIFTGNMTIGENARVEGNGKNLAFSRSLTPGAEMITIGSQGVATTGDVIIGAGGGGIRSYGGTVTGDEVVLRASNGIGTPSARVKTAANALALNNVGGGGVFVSELDNVTLRAISLNAGGPFTVSNTNNGSFSLISGGDVNVAGVVTSGSMILDAGGNLRLDATSVDAELRSLGGQTISAQSIDLTAQNGRRAIIQNTDGNQSVTATTGDMNLQVPGGSGVAQIVNVSNLFSADQTISANGQLNVLGGAIAGTNSRNSGIFKNAGGLQTVSASGITLRGADTGTNAGAQIGSQGDQTIDVGAGDINLIGGNGGTTNNALILGGATGQQKIFAHDINLSNGFGGTDTVAAIQGGHQLIDLTGNVTLNSQGALLGTTPGGPGVRIGGLGGLNPTATDLKLFVDGSLTVNGGTARENGAAIGSTGTAVLANTILIDAGGNVILNAGTEQGTGVRIGSGSSGTAGGNITILADGSIQLNGTQRSAAIRTLGNVTLEATSISQGTNGFILADTLTTTTSGVTNLAGPNEIERFNGTSGGALTLVDGGALQVTGITTTNDAITLTTGSLTNTGTISNTGGASGVANMIFIADAFNLAGGTIDAGAAAVILRPRTGTNSFGIEAAGQTTLTNADIASVHTSDFVVFGSSMGTTFTGNMTIGENAQVDGGGKHLAFFRSINLGGTTTIGAQGVATAGDVIVAAGGGAIVSNGGTVRGDEVQLKAGQSIGTAAARIQTAANALALNSGNAFVSELDNLTLRDITLNVGGFTNFGNNILGGALDLAVGGALNVAAAGTFDAIVSSGGGQSISAQSVNVTAQDGRTAQILNTGAAGQSITAGSIDIQTGVGGGVAEIRNNAASSQNLTVTGERLTARALGGGTAAVFSGGAQTINMAGAGPQQIALGDHAAQGRAFISSIGNQAIQGNADLVLIGGSGPIADGSNAIISVLSPFSVQNIHARTITLANSMLGGNNSVAAIQGANQVITTTGDVTLTGNASGGNLAGVRIGGLGGAGATATNVTLNVGGDLVLTGGSVAGNGVGIGSTAALGAPPFENIVVINAQGSVILNSGVAGSGARIGSPQTGATPGSININAVGDIRLNGVDESATIRTTGTVNLNAASITEGPRGAVIAGTLLTNTAGATLLTGENHVSSYNGTSSGHLSLHNTGVLDVTGVTAGGDATLNNVGNVTVSGAWTAGGTSTITVASDIVLAAVLTSPNVVLNAGGGSISEIGAGAIVASTLSTTAGGATNLTGLNQVASYNGVSGGNLTLNNGVALDITGLNAGSHAAITNFGNVKLTGAWSSGSASISAFGPGASISEAGAGSIQTGTLSTFSEGATSLTGANQVQTFNGFTAFGAGGDITLNNSGPLTVTSLNAAGNATLANAGAVNVTGSWSSSGATSIETTGGGLALTSIMTSGGAMTLDVGGTLTVSANGPQFALVQATGGQSISAQSMEVLAQNGALASITNLGSGEQRITINGGGVGAGLDVHSQASGGSAQIVQQAAGFAQTIEVTDADHINVNGAGSGPLPGGAGGGAAIASLGGTQTISITGSGTNAIRLGSVGARGVSNVGGGIHQIVTAGLEGQQGSITIIGADVAQAPAILSTITAAGGTQTVSTSGTISITGGRTLNNVLSPGIFHNGTGQQTINAADIALTAGPSGSNNNAFINVSGGGVPASAGAQVVNVSGDITIAGDVGGTAGFFGSATREQTIHAHNISMTNSAGGGINSVAIIQGGHQTINATGDVTLTARASGGNLAGVRIGGFSGNVTTSTDLRLNVGGNLVLSGGTAPHNGVGIGSTAAETAPPLDNNIAITAGGSVILNSGTALGSGARIGAPATPGGLNSSGNLSISAGGGIELNGAGQSAAIRTLGGTVTLAADHITETGNGFIVAGTLNTRTRGAQTLVGPNQVAAFTAASAAGNVSLRNTAPVLTLGSMDLPGSLTIDQTGTLSIPGTVSALSHVIDATGDVLVGSADATNAALLYASDSISIAAGGSVIVRGSDVTPMAASAVLADGNLHVAAGNVSIIGGGALLTPAAMRGEAVDINAASELRVRGGRGHLSPALLSSGTDVNLTIGDAVRVDAGSGLLSLARIQTEIKNGVIHISFPDLARGGYFVNGVEGRTHQGETGFFTLNKPAKVGKTLLLEYGD